MQTKLLINGALVAGEGESHAVYNPSQGNVLVRITEASGAQVHAAVQSADAGACRDKGEIHSFGL